MNARSSLEEKSLDSLYTLEWQLWGEENWTDQSNTKETELTEVVFDWVWRVREKLDSGITPVYINVQTHQIIKILNMGIKKTLKWYKTEKKIVV